MSGERKFKVGDLVEPTMQMIGQKYLGIVVSPAPEYDAYDVYWIASPFSKNTIQTWQFNNLIYFRLNNSKNKIIL